MGSEFGVPTVIGFNGSLTSSLPERPGERPWGWAVEQMTSHDAAAVLVRGGKIVAAVEEERLSRVKHTNRLPVHAIQACLEIAGVPIEAVDRIAYYTSESYLEDMVLVKHRSLQGHPTPRAFIAATLERELHSPIDPDRMAFVGHHRAHAVSAYVVAPFTDALVVTLDGVGEGLSGSISTGCDRTLTTLATIPQKHSLGLLYFETIHYLGYGPFDEYKVMGLAPYGRSSRYRHTFESVYALGPNGAFTLDLAKLHVVLRELFPTPRKHHEPLEDIHRDVAASLQEAVENAVFHMLRHYQGSTGLRRLCLAGGVAHNSTLVGKIVRSSLFDNVFVQPAAHDSGCALGAALAVHQELAPESRIEPLSHVFLGKDMGDAGRVREALEHWEGFVERRRSVDLVGEAAALLEEGGVIGWVQGRSEFGPRALGNRSILADPRAASQRDVVNGAVKMRESYRPFAPAVIEEAVSEFFELAPNECAPFMTLTAYVREDKRAQLGAVTHVDGTARVQTVSRQINPRFWALLDAFGRRTGVPVLLNTSFNHSVEPIVDSVHDAVTCLLTTGLTALVVDDYIVTKPVAPAALSALVPVLPEHVRIAASRQMLSREQLGSVFWCEDVVVGTIVPISEGAYALLSRADARRSIVELMQEQQAGDEDAVVRECEALWHRRLIKLLPCGVSSRLAQGESSEGIDRPTIHSH
jgi:carbamoyltransferase